MRSTLSLFAAIPMLFVAAGAGAQAVDPSTNSGITAAEGSSATLDLDLPETEERERTILLQNFLDMDLNGDLLLAETEWEAWAGWSDTVPPEFAPMDANDSMYLSYGEFEQAALTLDEPRLGYAPHGGGVPEEAVGMERPGNQAP